MVTIIAAGSAIAAFSCLLLLTKRPLADSDGIAAAFMLLLALPMLEKLLLAGSIALPYLGFGLFSGAPLAFGPFLYLYARSVINPASLPASRRLLHFGPFLASVGVFLVTGLAKPAMPAFPAADSTGSTSLGPWPNVLGILMVLSFLAYTLRIVAMLRAHARGIPDYFSHDSITINLKWLGWITLGLFLAYATAILGELAFSGKGGSQIPNATVLRDASTLFFAVIFGFCAIKQPVLFKAAIGNAAEPAPPEIDEAPARRYGKSGLGEGDASALLARLEELMHGAKPWLDPDLTIEDLSLSLGVQRRPRRGLQLQVRFQRGLQGHHGLHPLGVQEKRPALAARTEKPPLAGTVILESFCRRAR